MFAIYKKEIKIFFNTIEAYLAIGVFLIVAALILWFIPSEYNIFYNNQASLLPFFLVSPWILLLLIPAITMKMISVEILEKTITILITKPIKNWEIVYGKFLASITIGVLAIIPSIIFAYSIYQLSEPKGNIDMGELTGSYIGLIMIICCYSSIGILCSSMSKNPMISFITTIIIIFFFAFGIDIISNVYQINQLKYLSLLSHYESISRGVIDSRDMIYFISFIILFLNAAVIKIQYNRT